jgi:hypothetical protein
MPPMVIPNLRLLRVKDLLLAPNSRKLIYAANVPSRAYSPVKNSLYYKS